MPTPVATARKGSLLALAGACLWGTTGTSQALLVGHHTPVAVGALRALVAAMALLAVVLARGGGRGALADAVRGRRRGWVALAGACVGFYQLTFFAAVSLTGVGVGTLVVLSTSPVVAGMVGWLVHRERPSRAWLVSTLLALAGVSLLVLGSSAERHVNWGGLAVAVLAGACFGIYSVAGRMAATVGGSEQPPDGLAITCWVFLVATLVSAVPLARQPLGFLTVPRNAGVVVWLGVASAALAYLLFQQGMATITAATAATLALAEPMVANILAVVVLHEPFTWVMGCGVALVLAGLGLLSRA